MSLSVTPKLRLIGLRRESDERGRLPLTFLSVQMSLKVTEEDCVAGNRSPVFHTSLDLSMFSEREALGQMWKARQAVLPI